MSDCQAAYDFPFPAKPGDECIVMWIDSKHRFVRSGWFFGKMRDTHDGIEYTNYEQDADRLVPGWKRLSIENWYFIDGQWNKRTASCGMVKHG